MLDATLFLEGRNSLFPDPVREDDRLASLLCFDYRPNVKLMLKQCPELMFGGFVYLLKKMLGDHLHGGKYAAPDQNLCQETLSVPTTNANPEQDFGMLDRLMKLKPKALDIVYEESSCLQLIIQEVGVTVFLKISLTLQWALQENQKNCREKYTSKKKQKKNMIHATRAKRLEKNMEEERRKDMNLVLKKER